MIKRAITNKNGMLPSYLLSWFVVIFGLHMTRGSSVVFSRAQFVFICQMTIKSLKEMKS